MTGTTAALLTALVAVLAVPGVRAEETAMTPVGPRLAPELRSLLGQEMAAIQTASALVQEALWRGQTQIVAAQAAGIRDSFILKKRMTPALAQSLRATVGDAFVQRDRAFHKLAGELAAAAVAGDRPLQHRLFGEMIAACAGCHARYATDRFPEFAADPAADPAPTPTLGEER